MAGRIFEGRIWAGKWRRRSGEAASVDGTSSMMGAIGFRMHSKWLMAEPLELPSMNGISSMIGATGFLMCSKWQMADGGAVGDAFNEWHIIHDRCYLFPDA